MELRPLLLQIWHQTQVPLLDLAHHRMLPNSIPIPRPKWGPNTRSAMEHPLTQSAFMKSIEVVFLRKEMIGNHDKSSRNTNRNRIFCYHHKDDTQARDYEASLSLQKSTLSQIHNSFHSTPGQIS